MVSLFNAHGDPEFIRNLMESAESPNPWDELVSAWSQAQRLRSACTHAESHSHLTWRSFGKKVGWAATFGRYQLLMLLWDPASPQLAGEKLRSSATAVLSAPARPAAGVGEHLRLRPYEPTMAMAEHRVW